MRMASAMTWDIVMSVIMMKMAFTAAGAMTEVTLMTALALGNNLYSYIAFNQI